MSKRAKIIIACLVLLSLLVVAGRLAFLEVYYDKLHVENNMSSPICFYDDGRLLMRVRANSKKSRTFLPRSKGGFDVNNCQSNAYTVSYGFYEKYLNLSHKFRFDAGYDFEKSECEIFTESRLIWCHNPA